MLKRFAVLFTALLAVSALQAQPVNVFIIDNFNTTNGSAADPTLNANGVWAGFNPGAPVLGNNRILGNYLTEVTAGDPGPFTNQTNVASGVFSIDNPFNTRSSGQVIWQGNTTTPGTNPIISHPASFALGNINFNTLVSTPNFYFQWSVINADNRDWTYTVRAYTDNASNYFEGTITSNQSGLLLSIPKVSFTAVGTPNWTNIDAVSFSASYTGGLLGGDLAIDVFQLAVPEMSTYLMIGLTVIIIGCYYVFRHGKKGDKKTEEVVEVVKEEPIGDFIDLASLEQPVLA
jgi:hypothetical protein